MPQVKVGTIVSTKMQKVATVKVESQIKHPLYKKPMKRSKNFKAQNEIDAKVGQIVKIQEIRPISKEVHFKIVEVQK